MFDKFLNDLQSQIGELAKSGLTELGKQLNEKWGIPKPDGEFEFWQSFNIKEYEVRHYFKKEKYPATFWINLNFFERGTIWIKDIRLFQAPFKPKD